MPVHVKQGGVWRELKSVHVKENGVWRTLKTIHVKDGFSTRQIGFNPFITMSNYSADTGNVGSTFSMRDQYQITSTGNLRRRRGGTTTYTQLENILGGSTSASEVWVDVVRTSGTAFDEEWSGRVRLDSVPLTGFGYAFSTSGIKSGNARLDFYDAASGGNLIHSATVGLYARKL